MSEEKKNEPTETQPAPEVQQLVKTLGTVGAAWARYGLTIGRAAL